MRDFEMLGRAIRLAACFGAALRSLLTEQEVRQVVEANRSHRGTDYADTCASHDVCDANMVMAEAFTQSEGRPMVIGADDDGEQANKEMQDLTLSNLAWSIAKAVDFEPQEPFLRDKLLTLIQDLRDTFCSPLELARQNTEAALIALSGEGASCPSGADGSLSLWTGQLPVLLKSSKT